jgi:membrane-associated PAP2 superfamily phosphatase
MTLSTLQKNAAGGGPGTAVRRDLWLTALGLLAVLLWDASGADMALMRLVGNASGFAWRDAWLTRDVLHQGGRVLAWCVLGLLVIDAIKPLMAGPPRAQRVQGVIVVLMCLLLIPSLKRLSLTSCPWDLVDFGGIAQHVSHWHLGEADGGPGHCFPSGHAVAAFGFFGIYFAWRGHRPALARGALLATLVLGTAFGVAQMARGAHFVSHTLWSAWLCWAVAVGASLVSLTLAKRGGRSRPGAAAAGLDGAPL